MAEQELASESEKCTICGGVLRFELMFRDEPWFVCENDPHHRIHKFELDEGGETKYEELIYIYIDT